MLAIHLSPLDKRSTEFRVDRRDMRKPRPTNDWKVLSRLDNGLEAGLNNDGIYVVHDTCTGTRAVLKKLTDMDVLIGEGQKEIDALRHLDHPNIVRLLDWFLDQEEGEDRYPGPVPEPFIWRVLESSVKALEHCHNYTGMSHNDIHPGNIFLSSFAPDYTKLKNKSPRILLADFGSAAKIGRSRHGGSSDIYQVGLVIHWLCHANSRICWKKYLTSDEKACRYFEGAGQNYSQFLNCVLR
ncbi:kinase-like domain-containing protein, partial [Lophiotrema nucula]